MSLPLKPHSWTLKTVAQAVDVGDLHLEPEVYTSVGTDTGMIEPLTPDAALRGFGLDLTRPYRLLADVTMKARYVPGSRVEWESKVFAVAAPAKEAEQGFGLNHITVALERLDYA